MMPAPGRDEEPFAGPQHDFPAGGVCKCREALEVGRLDVDGAHIALRRDTTAAAVLGVEVACLVGRKELDALVAEDVGRV